MKRAHVLIAVSLVTALLNDEVQASDPEVGDEAPTSKANPLVWDATAKSYTGAPGAIKHEFAFTATNTGAQSVIIQRIDPSCSCTEVMMPDTPLRLAPGTTHTVRATVNFPDKTGTLTKSLFVQSDAGLQQLRLTVTIAPTTADKSRAVHRTQNQELARIDRQAVFRNDCARCHATPAAGKTGEALYHAVCAVCHETENRATMVPDLSAASAPRDVAFWSRWIADGGKGTLMPAFAANAGGPLTDDQIASLTAFLTKRFPGTLPSRSALR